jgi:Trp operon repressor
VPLIKEYLDVAVKNDDALVRMAAIVQRAMARNDSGDLDALLLTEDEKRQLIETMSEVKEPTDISPPKELDDKKIEKDNG